MKKVIPIIILAVFIPIGFFFWASAPSEDMAQQRIIISVSHTRPNAHNDTLTLLNYNIGYLSGMTNNRPIARKKQNFQNRLKEAINLFKKHQPDILCFQEIDFNSHRSFNVDQLQEIASAIHYPTYARAVNWNKRYVPFPYWPLKMHFREVYSGQATLSKYPILGQDVHTLVRPENNPFYYDAFYIDRLAQVVKLNIQGHEIVIINVHLEAYDPPTRYLQLKQVMAICHQYSENFGVILCGDFNSPPPNISENDHVIETLMADFKMEMAMPIGINNTQNNQFLTFPSNAPSKRIDYIFYNPKFIKYVSACVLTDAGQISDHFPVKMKFTLR